MVNTGRPSGACGVCRERRIKCDETKPACLKCIRSGRSCSGYSHGLKLRDQTQKTIIKAQLGKPRARRQNTTNTTAAGGGGNGNGNTERRKKSTSPEARPEPSPAEARPKQVTVRSRSLSLPGTSGGGGGGDPWFFYASGGQDTRAALRRRNSTGYDASHEDEDWEMDALTFEGLTLDTLHCQTLHTPLVEKARCYFLSSYVVYSPTAANEGMFTFIPSILQNAAASHQYFEDMFTAVSIAAFSMRPNSSHAAPYAQLYYGRAVAGLGKAIADKSMVKSDAALASTILLGFYEGIVTEGSGIETSNPHFQGALALLRVRGDEQFSTACGLEMFDFIMQVLMRQYDMTLSFTEEEMCSWTMQASMHPGAEGPALMPMWVANLRLRVARIVDRNERTPETLQAAMELLGMAQKFECMVTQGFEAEGSELAATERHLPSRTPEHPAETTIVYADWWTATRALNKYAFRLLLCHIIADVSEWLDGPEAQFRGSTSKAIDIARTDIENIIASIPYLCAWSAGQPRGASSPCGRDDVSSVEGLTSFVAIWPLYLAGDSRFASPEQKRYILRKLKWMGENVGVKHAVCISRQMENGSVNGDEACIVS